MNALDSTWGLEDSRAHACLELIRRHAPRMMRAGGGPLIQSANRVGENQGKPLAPAKKRRVIALLRRGGRTMTIARRAGVAPSTVCRIRAKLKIQASCASM